MIRRALIATTAVAMLAGCTAGQISTTETDMSAALSDVMAAEPLIAAIPGVPGWFVADITLADNGLSSILTAVEANSGTVEAASLAGLTTAVADLKADLPANATVQTDAGVASTALSALSAAQSQSTEVQAFTAVAALALAVEQAEQPAAGRVGAISPAQSLINDAHGHLADLH